MVQLDNQKLVSQRSRVRLQAVLVFIKNLINDKSKRKTKNVTICFVLSGARITYTSL